MTGDSSTSHIVVACPPDPAAGGSRFDARLQAVATALQTHEIDCLRFDYPTDGDDVDMQQDTRRVLTWAHDHYDSVGIFGYSRGGRIAFSVATASPASVSAVSLLAPARRSLSSQSVSVPLQVLTGTTDTVVQTPPSWLLTAATDVQTFETGHGFAGVIDTVATTVGRFFDRTLGSPA